MYSYISKSSTTYWVQLSGNSDYKASPFYVSTILCVKEYDCLYYQLYNLLLLLKKVVQQPVVAVPDVQTWANIIGPMHSQRFTCNSCSLLVPSIVKLQAFTYANCYQYYTLLVSPITTKLLAWLNFNLCEDSQNRHHGTMSRVSCSAWKHNSIMQSWENWSQNNASCY